MKIFLLLAIGLVMSLSALSARELKSPVQSADLSHEKIEQDLNQKLEVMSEIMTRKNEFKAIRSYR